MDYGMRHRRGLAATAVLFGLLWVSSMASAAGLSLHSKAFENGQPIPKRYACNGAGLSPPLTIAGVPSRARSLALIVDDSDAPGGVFTHWVLYNLATDLVVLAPGASDQPLPGPAATADNSTHHADYHGVCPPPGDGVHHYHFKLFVLDERLPQHLDDKAAVEKAMQGHVIGKTQLVGTYQRQ